MKFGIGDFMDPVTGDKNFDEKRKANFLIEHFSSVFNDTQGIQGTTQGRHGN